jgi:hypothetical protein
MRIIRKQRQNKNHIPKTHQKQTINQNKLNQVIGAQQRKRENHFLNAGIFNPVDLRPQLLSQ